MLLLDKPPLFEVNLNGFEPHTFRTGSGYAKIKKELCEAILEKVGQSYLALARKKVSDKPISLRILFRLWEGSKEVTNTRPMKDLDNLLKPVLDVLQTSTDAQNSQPGLNIIENDKLVYEINVRKEIVKEESDEGVYISIFLMDSPKSGWMWMD